MLKSTITYLLALSLIFLFCYINVTPVFKGYADEYEVYLGNKGSLSQIISVNESDFIYLENLSGESFTIDKENFNLEKFLTDYDAKLVFVEEIESGISYYAYSKKIKYKANIDKKLINLHVFIGKTNIKVGSPIIYGSF